MDNVTHSLVGLAAAECLIRRQESKGQAISPIAAKWAWVVSLVANNFPDLDFLYCDITPGKLGYLLHHRGHTHTVLGAFAESAFIFGLVWLGLKSVHRVFRPHEWRVLFWAILIGPLLHISMDSLNSYGVHPFWPLYSGWFYGDTLFIVEPWLWMLLTPPLFVAAKSSLARILLAPICVFAIGLSLKTRMVPVPIVMALVVGCVGSYFLARRLGPSRSGSLAVKFALGIVVVFLIFSRVARVSVTRESALRYPSASIQDVVLTPAPANPFCWNFILVAIDDHKYRLIRGTYAPIFSCSSFLTRETTAMRATEPTMTSSNFLWLAQYETPLSKAKEWASHCESQALLRFARAPFFVEQTGVLIGGDLRFDRSPALEFSEFVTDPHRCPPYIPGWEYPRDFLIR